MNEIKIFENQKFGRIRAVEIEKKPMFVASDIAKALGYAIPSKAIQTHCKAVSKMEGRVQTGVKADGTSAIQYVEMIMIPEADVYRLIMRSKLPQAEQFQDWVCEDILPSIRKYGAYMAAETVEDMIKNPDNMIKLLTALKTEQEQNALLRTQNTENAKAIRIMSHKANYYDTVLQASGLIQTDVIAAALGTSARKLNEFLRDTGIQYRRGDVWVLYGDIRGKGLEGYKSFPYIDPITGQIKARQHMYWTEEGRNFIISLYTVNLYKQSN